MVRLVLILALLSISRADKSSGNAQFKDGGEFGISTKGNWMSLQWATLSEVDSAGTVVQSVDLSKNHYGWSEPEVTPVLGADGTDTGDRLPGANVSVILKNGALFNVTVWIVGAENATNASGKREYVKFSIFVGDWPFVGSSNGNVEGVDETTLVLTAGLVGFGGMVRSDQNTAKDGNSSTDLTFGAGYLNSPNEAIYDGNTSDTVRVTNSEKGKPVVMWTFRRFEHNVSYDPTFGGSDGTNSGTTLLPSTLFSLFSLIFLALHL